MSRALLVSLSLLSLAFLGCPPDGTGGESSSSSSSTGGAGSSSSGGTASSSSSSSSGGGEAAAATAARALFDALCDYDTRCTATRGPGYSSNAACRAAVDKAILLEEPTYLGASRVYRVDQAVLAQCTASLGTASCNQRVPLEVLDCQDALTPIIPRQPGQSCSTGTEEGAPACATPSLNRCNPTGGGTCGTCAAKKANGESCSANEECRSSFCNNLALVGTNQCEDVPVGKSKGASCFDSLECNGNLVCAGGMFQKACAERAGAGQACSAARNSDKPECLTDLLCLNGTCALPLEDGQSCTRSSTPPLCRNLCGFSTPDAATGACATFPSLPGAGQPCAYLGATPQCSESAGVFADETRPASGGAATACTCRALLAAGSPCTANAACQSGGCVGMSGSTPGTCKALVEDGNACSADQECVSGHCVTSGSAKTCGLPSCP